ncbi:MAG: ABC transporter permease [Cyclobacteriaceae bacterium]
MKKDLSNPPRLAEIIFAWIVGRADLEDIQGDLDEVFYQDLDKKGSFRAKANYWVQVVSLFFSYALKKRKSNASFSPYSASSGWGIFKNYFKVAFRSLVKERLFTTINIVGLAVGMSVNLLIIAILSQVLQFDDFHINKDHIYRVLTEVEDENGKYTYASTFEPVYEGFSKDYSGIKQIVCVDNKFNPTIQHYDEKITLSGAQVDASFFEVFSFDLAKGNKFTALAEPNSIVLSRKIAEKLFRNEDAFGKVIEIHNEPYEVTGILKDHPKQTHLNFDVLVSFNSNDNDVAADKWSNYRYAYTYLMLDETKKPSDFDFALSDLNLKINSQNDKASVRLSLQPLKDISPGGNIYNDNTPFDWITCVLLFFLGLLILIPACFNYTNLTIARALKRAKEIGIRKVVGSHKWQIAYQFIVEAILVTLIALLGSVVIFNVIRDEFLSMVIGAETLDLTLSWSLILWFVCFGVLAGIVAGLFPAIYLSRIKPLEAIRSELKSNSVSISSIRKTLVIFQFSVSIVFIIGVAVVIKQYRDLLNYDLGFNKQNTLAIPTKGTDSQILINEFGTISEISAISRSSDLPGLGVASEVRVFVSENPNDSVLAHQIFVDEAFISSLGFEMLWEKSDARFTSKGFEQVFANEAFMRRLRSLHSSSDRLGFVVDQKHPLAVSGVLQDFNFMPLNATISPLIIRFAPEKSNYVLAVLDTRKPTEVLNLLEQKWDNVNPSVPFESFFLEDQIQTSYRSAFLMIKIFSFLGLLSITVSCLGLLGIVVYMTENRIKEVAIRKIMGASASDLYTLLGKSFIKLLTLSALIAIPIAYLLYDKVVVLLINKYSVGVGWIEFMAGIAIVLVLGILPVFWMVTKVSGINPAVNLRNE